MKKKIFKISGKKYSCQIKATDNLIHKRGFSAVVPHRAMKAISTVKLHLYHFGNCKGYDFFFKL